MKRFAFASIGFVGLLSLAVAFGLSGCSQPGTSDTGTAATPAAGSTGEGHEDGHAGHEHGHEDGEGHGGMAAMEKGLAELSDADRASAMKQHTCPVSGEMLGTMGKPIKVTAGDKELWICCDGCRKQFEADPDKYVAKLAGDGQQDADGDHGKHQHDK